MSFEREDLSNTSGVIFSERPLGDSVISFVRGLFRGVELTLRNVVLLSKTSRNVAGVGVPKTTVSKHQDILSEVLKQLV